MNTPITRDNSPEQLKRPALYDFRYIADAVRDIAKNIPDIRNSVLTPLLLDVTDELSHIELPLGELKDQVGIESRARIATKVPSVELLNAESQLRTPDRKSVPLFEHAESLLSQKTDLLLNKILDAKPIQTKLNRLRKFGMTMRHGGVEKVELSLEAKEAIRQKNVSSWLNELLEIMEGLCDNPAQLLARLIPEEQLIAFTKTAQAKDVDEVTEISHDISPTREVRIATYSGRIAIADEQIPEKEPSSVPISSLSSSKVENKKMDNPILLELLWSPDITEYRGKLYEDVHELAVIRALEPRLATLATKLSEGQILNKDGMDKYDLAIHELARKISSGHMPFMNSNGMLNTNLSDADKQPQYRGIPIWYNFDKSPNAPRVYFTLMRGGLSETGKEQWNMIVLGITDMQNQLQLFKYISTKTTKELRRMGVGAV